MLSRSLPLFRAFGVEVNVHWSWLILALLIGSSLATGWYPALVPGLDRSAYWLPAILGTIGLFISIVVHELCHAIVGRFYKMHMEKITLFLFGGVAHMEDEPPSAKAEFQMAIAGPLASLALVAVFFGLLRWSNAAGGSALLQATLSYLASVNLVVAIFNMLPGFPLDGGRVLRSALWSYKGDIVWATKYASGIGQGFGGILIIIGLLTMIGGSGLSGIWSCLLGFLVVTFARSSYVQVLVKRALHGKPAATFMDATPLTVSPETSVSELVRDYLNESDQTLYPVISSTQEFIGCVDLASVKKFPEEEWRSHQVAEILEPCPLDHKITPETDAETALMSMSKSGYKELIVVQGNKLLGVLTRHALLRYLTLQEPKMQGMPS